MNGSRSGLDLMRRRLRALRLPAALGLLVWAAVGSWLLRGGPQSAAARALAGAALGAGLVHAWYAARVAFDAHLLGCLLTAGLEGSAAARALDTALAARGLRRRPAGPPRDWPARWHGMRRLGRRQLAWLAATLLAAAGAAGLAAWPAPAATAFGTPARQAAEAVRADRPAPPPARHRTVRFPSPAPPA